MMRGQELVECVSALLFGVSAQAPDDRGRARMALSGRCQSKILNTWSGHRTAQIDPEKCRKINGHEIRF
jgi:hypothetical protein